MRPSTPAVAALVLLAAACAGGLSDPTPDELPPHPDPTKQIQSTLPEGPSALENPDAAEFPEPLVDPAQIISGGPPPDGIPPIDHPEFISISAADEWLDNAEPVVVIEMDDDARAYPVQILIWHEIINDTVGGVPVAITYCPLCNSAVSYRRTVDGIDTTFGTSGRLFASALVMYDRATESLWTHFDGRAVVGVLTGRKLDPIPSPLLAWGDFKVAHPSGLVLDRQATGFDRPYGQNPYVGYDDAEASPFLYRGTADVRAAAMRRVVGVVIDDVAAAWALDNVSGGEARATNSELAGRPLVIFWKAGQSSALDTASISQGSDVGSVGVFDPVIDGRTLNFIADGERFTDAETGSTWDITGVAAAGELAGTQLERIVHLDTFWFAWSTYRPGTTLVTG